MDPNREIRFHEVARLLQELTAKDPTLLGAPTWIDSKQEIVPEITVNQPQPVI